MNIGKDVSEPPLSRHSDEVADRMEGGFTSNAARPVDTNKPCVVSDKSGELASKLPPPLDLKKREDQQSDEVFQKTDPGSKDVASKPAAKKRKRWKKPKDKPNRPLSAYNLFFQAQRAEMLGEASVGKNVDKTSKRVHRKTHGKVSFAEMARSIGARWKNLSVEDKKPYEEQAKQLKIQYKSELEVWKKEQKRKVHDEYKKTKSQAFHSPSLDMSTSLPAGNTASSETLRLQMMVGSVGNTDHLGVSTSSDSQRMRQRAGAMRGMEAAEASSNALLHQFQGMNQGGQQSNPQQQLTPEQAQAQLIELQRQQLELQQKQARLLELQQQMNVGQRQGNFGTNNFQQLMMQSAMQPRGRVDLQQGLGNQQQQRQFGQSGGGERVNQVPQFQPQLSENMAAAMRRLQERYGM